MTTSRFRETGLYAAAPTIRLDENVWGALNGAGYHLYRIAELIKRPEMRGIGQDDSSQDKGVQQDIVNAIHWHLRAFCWELHATWDNMLVWANQRYELGFAKGFEIQWRNLHERQAGKDPGDWTQTYTTLDNARNTAWFFEVSHYRHYAHRGFKYVHISRRSDSATQPQWYLEPIREGQNYAELIPHLDGYLSEMRTLVQSTLSR